MFRWWHRLWCRHTETRLTEETYTSAEWDEDDVYAFIVCTNNKCRKVLGRQTVGYRSNGIYL